MQRIIFKSISINISISHLGETILTQTHWYVINISPSYKFIECRSKPEMTEKWFNYSDDDEWLEL